MASLFAVLLVACGGQADEENSIPSVTDSKVEQELPEEAKLDFDLPDNYEEAAKDFATNFTLNWAGAYRRNNGLSLQTALDEYSDMIDKPTPYNDIVLEWNNSHSVYSNAYKRYVAGPTVSSVTIQNKYIENNAVFLTVEVTMTATVQMYTELTWSYTGYPISVIETGVYEMYYNVSGWHCKNASLRLNG